MAGKQEHPWEFNAHVRVVNEVRRGSIVTRRQVQDALGLSKGTMTRVVKPLIAQKFLATTVPTIDHRSTPLALCPSLGYMVGVDVRLDEVRVAVADASYELLNDPEDTRITVPITNARKTLMTIADAVVRELRTRKIPAAKIIGVGIGLPGPIRRDTGVVDSEFILPGWQGVSVRDDLQELLSERHLPAVRVVVGNDASNGALGVFTRAVIADPQHAPRDILYLRITHGIGAGLVMKGHLVTGGAGFAGEIGHVRVEESGPLCPRCGARGCLETVASEDAVLREVKAAARLPDGASFSDAFASRHPARQHALWDAGWKVGLAAALACNLLNPTWLVLGGDMTDSSTFYGALHHGIERNALPQAHATVTVLKWTNLFGEGDDARPPGRDVGRTLTPELLGTLALVLDEIGDDYVLPKVQAALDAGKLTPPRHGKEDEDEAA